MQLPIQVSRGFRGATNQVHHGTERFGSEVRDQGGLEFETAVFGTDSSGERSRVRSVCATLINGHVAEDESFTLSLEDGDRHPNLRAEVRVAGQGQAVLAISNEESAYRSEVCVPLGCLAVDGGWLLADSAAAVQVTAGPDGVSVQVDGLPAAHSAGWRRPSTLAPTDRSTIP
ncbi:MAG: hypothetical protein AB1758_14335 [Candidatus Eremiobacterota bacterium]